MDFNLEEYVASLDKNQRREFAQAFGYIPSSPEPTPTIDWKETAASVLASPKESIWYGVMILTAKAYLGRKFGLVVLLLVILQAGPNALRDAFKNLNPDKPAD